MGKGRFVSRILRVAFAFAMDEELLTASENEKRQGLADNGTIIGLPCNK